MSAVKEKKNECRTGYSIIVMSPNNWGRGTTIPEARKACRKAGARGQLPMIAVLMPAPVDEVWVDDMGGVCWKTERNGERSICLGDI